MRKEIISFRVKDEHILKKAYKRKRNRHITFLYIPENESSTKTLRLAAWIPFIIMLLIASTFTYAVSYTIAYNNLKIEYESSLCSIKNITAINNSQKIEIEKLEDNARQVQTQLYENIAALQELKEAVGVKCDKAPPAIPVNKIEEPSVLHPVIPLQPILSNNDADYSEHINGLKTSLVSLSKEAKSLKTEIEDSVKPIKERLSYLKAKPTGIPVKGRITANYGYRKNPFTNRGSEFHKGVDIAAKTGTSVVSTADGIVTFAGWKSGYGYLVIVSHGYGFTTAYAHNSKIVVKIGDKVTRGQVISKVGATGRSTAPHCHYEVKLNGKNVDPSRYF